MLGTLKSTAMPGLLVVCLLAGRAQAACPQALEAYAAKTYDLAVAVDRMGQTGLMDEAEHRHWLAWLKQRNHVGRQTLEAAPADTCDWALDVETGALAPLEAFIETRRGSVNPMMIR